MRRHPALPSGGLVLALVVLVGCPEPEVLLSGGDLYAPEALEVSPGLAVVPNMDDDNEDGDVDWDEAGEAADDDDRGHLYVQPEAFVGLKRNEVLVLEVGGDVSDVRVYQGGQQVLGDVEGPNLTSHTLTESEEVQTFAVEVQDFLSQGTITLRRLDADGESIESHTVWFTGAPLVLNHHLQETEHVWVVNIPGGAGYNNQQMVDTYEDVLDEQFTAIEPEPYDWDVWVQDEFQMGTLSSPESRSDLVVDSIRDRGLDDWAEDTFDRADDLVMTWGEQGTQNSLDSFGNLEVSPPVTVGGVEYPLGRIYYGANSSRYPSEDLTDFLASQRVQEPFEVDTSWLCVGHIDEYTSFVPDDTAPRGFRFVYADTQAAWDVLEEMDSSAELARYGGAPPWDGHGLGTVDEIVNSNALRFLNDETQEDILDPILEVFTEELDLTEEEIVWMPSLFEEPQGCGSLQAALIPGMANMIVANRDGATDIFLADPFMRNSMSSEVGQDEDPMIQAVVDAMPPDIDFHFVDDWNVYHMGLGEVHCGTNMTRTPTDWWSGTGPLLEDLD